VTNPLVAPEVSSTTWYTGLGLIEDAMLVTNGIRNDSWVDGTLGTVGGGLDILALAIDPLGSLVAWGVSWLMEHVRPLKEALDWLAGNPDAIAAHAGTWENVSKFTADASTRFADAIKYETAGWLGASGDAYREHAGIQASVLEGIATAAHGISYAVQGAGLLVGLVRGIVRDLIAQFVGTLAARLPQWLAEVGFTLGIGTPVVVGQVAALVAQWVDKIQVFIRALLNSLRKLKPMIEKLGTILTELKATLGKLATSDPFRKGDEPSLAGAGPGWRPGDPIPPPRAGNNLPTDAKLLDKYKYEADPTDPRRAFYPQTVNYMTPEVLEKHRLFVDAKGELRSAHDGSLFDTTRARTHFSGGRAIFVMDGDGNLYASLNQQVGHTHHSSFLGGRPVVGAGEIEVHQGKMVAMTDQSGHYQPLPHMNDRVLGSLRGQGMTTDPGFKQYGWHGTER